MASAVLTAMAGISLVLAMVPTPGPTGPKIQRRTVAAPDGLAIVYSVAGTGEPALVFVHGGLADRSFWDAQLAAFAPRHRVIALDLGGHGESGTNRKTWGLPVLGADIAAVVHAERPQQVILFGNSLGGPAAIEAALLLGNRVLGVVGVDSLQQLDYKMDEAGTLSRAEAFRADFPGKMKEMVRLLFHPDVDPAIMADAERRMLRTNPEAGCAVIASLAGYDMGEAVRRLNAPIRAINGDLLPMNLEKSRRIRPDFSVIVMKHVGHYPMLERPDEFNRHVAAVVAELSAQPDRPPAAK